ncbi:hypothetical protein MRX96_053305 [Rhipicephalus microplus]
MLLVASRRPPREQPSFGERRSHETMECEQGWLQVCIVGRFGNAVRTGGRVAWPDIVRLRESRPYPVRCVARRVAGCVAGRVAERTGTNVDGASAEPLQRGASRLYVVTTAYGFQTFVSR